MQSCHLKAFTIWPKALIANNKSSKQEWEERFKMPRLQSSSFALLPPIIIHFHDMQSLWEKSFVSFQHFPPHFSSSTSTCPARRKLPTYNFLLLNQPMCWISTFYLMTSSFGCLYALYWFSHFIQSRDTQQWEGFQKGKDDRSTT